MVIPDCAIFVPESLVKNLSDSKDSAFKVLKRHKKVAKVGAPGKQTSFAYQSTPSMSLANAPCFEFASSFSEDKKPSHQILEDAYRQNRMSTAAAVRHLHSLHVNAPVFGLVWASNNVRAHVDWWKVSDDGQLVCFLGVPHDKYQQRK